MLRRNLHPEKRQIVVLFRRPEQIDSEALHQLIDWQVAKVLGGGSSDGLPTG